MASGDSHSERSDKKNGTHADGTIESILDEWGDVEFAPLPLNDVVAIEFSDEFRNIFGLLLTVQHRKERSERCLRLSRAAIKLNKADVTAWRFRQETVSALAREKGAAIWTAELPFVTAIIMSSPKNYQAWEHRRFIALHLQQFDAEIDFVDLILDRDAKNYHAWAYRYWVVCEGRAQSDELGATQWFISNDVRNNSAWNHRWLLVKDLDLPAREAQMRLGAGRCRHGGAEWKRMEFCACAGCVWCDSRICEKSCKPDFGKR